MRLIASLSLALVVALCLAVGTRADEPRQDKEEVAEPFLVELVISPEFKVAQPAGQMTCFIHNRSEQDVTVPAGYDARRIRLYGVGLVDGKRAQRWPLLLHMRSSAVDDSQTTIVKAGQKVKLFEFPLAEVLADTRRVFSPESAKLQASAAKPPAKPTAATRFGWDWLGRPMPPPSPILRRDGYLAAGEFWVEIRVGETDLQSDRVPLKVVEGDDVTDATQNQ